MMRHVRDGLTAMLLTALAGAAGAAETLPLLSDVLEKPAYRTAFDRMVKGQKLAPWVQTFIKTKNGVVSAGESRTINGTAYEEYDVCEPHNCGGNFLFVIFSPGGKQAYGAFIQEGSNVRYFGNPPGGVRQAFDKAVSLQR